LRNRDLFSTVVDRMTFQHNTKQGTRRPSFYGQRRSERLPDHTLVRGFSD
jgi:hypothetical protein